MKLTLISFFFLVAICKNIVSIPMVPSPGKCNDSFISVFPPRIMDNWYVMEHTDSLLPPMPDCLMMKLGRRISFNSELRIDIINSIVELATDTQINLPPIRGEVSVKANEPFMLNVPLSPVFPQNMMITDLDENNDCMAFWSCSEVLPSVSLRGAWVLCKSTDVEADVIAKLKETVAQKSEINPQLFIKTKYESCI